MHFAAAPVTLLALASLVAGSEMKSVVKTVLVGGSVEVMNATVVGKNYTIETKKDAKRSVKYVGSTNFTLPVSKRDLPVAYSGETSFSSPAGLRVKKRQNDNPPVAYSGSTSFNAPLGLKRRQVTIDREGDRINIEQNLKKRQITVDREGDRINIEQNLKRQITVDREGDRINIEQNI